MKRVFLMRHGKAEDGFDKPDFERNLQAKGERKTLKIAEFLSAKNIKPELILSSAANRTMQTSAIIAHTLKTSENAIIKTPSLYLASADQMLDEIYALDDHIDEIMIVGHNPGISSLAAYLSHSDIAWLSTSAIVGVELETEKWNDLDLAAKKLLFNIKPSSI
ncbi:MAG: histidine phosphatase family protein [Bacteroidales bacterium]|nr:histidine phosphatase family protein [Bacteroidales bacterium]